jgi:hypothetical protein
VEVVGPDPRAVRPPDPRVYAAVGGVGVALFVAGVLVPVLAWLPDADYARLGVAAVGGALAMFGLGRWNALRPRSRGKEPPPAPGSIPGIPSLRFYSPEPPATPAPEPDEELRTVVGVVGLLIVLLVAGLSIAPAGPGDGAARAPSVPAATPGLAGGAAPTPTCFPGIYPVYTTLRGLDPPLPLYSRQSPCKVAQDEVHTTFSSGAPGSGESFEVRIHLPGGRAPGDAALYADFYVGMVVQGNPSSVDGQSYAALVFTPGTSGSHTVWRATLAVWSMVLGTECPVGTYGPTGFNLTWAGQYACVVDETGDYNGTVLVPSMPGGENANVTMTGSATSASGALGVWFNDTTNSSLSAHFTLTAAATHTDEFRPYYVAACPDACVLNWTGPFGLGVGVDLCDSKTCFSYNQTELDLVPPIEVGPPAYWTGIAYTGTYLYLSPESSTGACSAVGSVAPCTAAAFAGYYPFFSFNGTELNFGGNFTWATETWGGASEQFNGFGTMNDYIPLFVDELTNSSRAGYLAPGVALNVSARVQVLGQIAMVNLSYASPGRSPGNETIDQVAGTGTDGTYEGDVPVTPDNGTIEFRVVATDTAGGVAAAPAYPAPNSSVVRGPVPSFSLTLLTVPPSCGGISVNGSAAEPNGTVESLLAGSYPIRATSCYPYVFDKWKATGGDSVAPDTPSALATLAGNGTISAVWTWVRPNDAVNLTWTPAGCGATELDGQEYLASDGDQQALLPNDGTYALVPTSCGGDEFSGWTLGNPENLTVLGTEVTVTGNGTLTANSLPTSVSVPVLFATDPAGCGGVLVNGAGYTTNETLNLRPGIDYAVGPDPCYGWGWAGAVTTSGGVSVAGGTLTLTSAGTVTYSYYELTLVSVVTAPASCGTVLWDGTSYANGAVLNVTNHTIHSLTALPCAGHYLDTWEITGDLLYSSGTIEVNGPGTVEAIFRSGTPTSTVEFLTDPLGCGSVVFGGTTFSNTEATTVSPGSVASVGALACANYGFVEWVPSGGVQVAGGIAYVNASGSLEAIFHPLVAVHIDTAPASCGAVVIAGVAYANGTVLEKPEDWHYAIAAQPCAHDTLVAWQLSSSVTIANGTLELNGTAVITAVYAAALYPVQLLVAPGGCGNVVLAGTSYGNNTTLNLTAGAYSITGSGCAGYAFSSWATTGGLNASGASLDVNSGGTLTDLEAAVPPSLSLAVPTSAPTGSAIVLRASVAVPVPPYNYTYLWSFGDGVNASTPTNFTSHAYASPGTYEVRVKVVDPLGRTASASASLVVVAASSGPTFEVGTPALLAIGGAIGVVVIAVVVALLLARRARSPPDEPSAPPAVPYPPPEDDAFPADSWQDPGGEAP